MEWYEAILLGLVQGLTEFLPVSSSGHLVIGREVLGVEASEDLAFEVLVHAATVLSTIVVFRKQIWGLLKGFFCGLRGLKVEHVNGSLSLACNDQTDYLLKIGVSMIPIFVVGMFFKDYVESLFGSITGVGVALLVTAVLLFFSDMASGKGVALKTKSDQSAKEYRNGISYWQAFAVGLGQAFAVAPGLSRSGTTISTGLICGVKREVMAQFSFLMVLAPILGEMLLNIVKGEVVFSSIGVAPLLAGFVSAFVVGCLACKFMLGIVSRGKLIWFALYCAVVGVISIICNFI
jgi:undecaprenyl-diphosphatase